MFAIPQKKAPNIKTRLQMFSIPQKKGPLRQNPTSKHPLDHFKSSPNVFNTSKQAPYDKIRLQNTRFIISNRVQIFSIPQKKGPHVNIRLQNTRLIISNRVQM